ncbi:sigma-E factor negative regulatory protein [Dokdonella ginsengisoli]|uniref:Sigma-E factor negative regulatory protein n=1 Tax=Dokdonella ginsengisoli TaxID=363846 RepID=A0ABV9QVY9_9GAMM
MNQTINEQLSALMDGELERDQTRFLLKRVLTDADLPQRWSRYHVARQTLRRQEVFVLPADFADRVMSRIEVEPAAQARSQPVWLRWGAGGAIAASVAVAALMVTQPQTAGPDRPAVASRGTAPAVSQPGGAAPIAVAPVAANAVQPSAGFRPPLLAPNAPIETAPVSFGSDLTQPIAVDPRMQSYLIRHYQTAGASGQTALVPYVLLAAPQREAAQPATTEPVPQNR